MSAHHARLIVALSIVLSVAGCHSSQKKVEARLGAPPSTYIFFEDDRQHVISLEDQQLARYQVLNGEDRGTIDLVDGSWEKTQSGLTLLFDGADSQHQWSLRAVDVGYELLNPEVIELETDVTVQFRHIIEYDVALRLYEWQLTHVKSGSRSTVIQTPSLYSLNFKDGVSYILRADCNQGLGHYQIRGTVLEVVPGLMTKNTCPPSSFSEQFLQWVIDEHRVVWGNSYQQLVLTSGEAQLTFNAVNVPAFR